jgi:PAS domain S-box-containing protein
VQVIKTPVYNSKGEVTGILGIFWDITERKRATEELRRLRKLLSSIVNSMPSVLVGVDNEGKVTQWNREAERATGVGGDEAQGQPLERVFPRLKAEMAKVREAIRSHQAQMETKVPREVDGETRYEDITVYPLSANGIEGAVIRVDDVTERVRIEEMMIQTEKMLSMGGLAAGMAHEINNPLAGILQNIQVIRDRISLDLPKNKRTAEECGTKMEAIQLYMERRNILKMIEAVLESGRRAAQIVDNMISFSRKGGSRLAPHNLCELLDKTIDLASSDYDLKKKYDFRQIEIIREYDPSMPKVPCERGQIQQVFLNLLKNGAQAMAEREGGKEQGAKREKGETPRFRLRVMQESDTACIEIEDNGPGMLEEVRKRVFEPFFSTKGVGAGTGLGLSVSYFIVTENHNGSMSVESTPGTGTKFIIRLPLVRNIATVNSSF